MGVILARPVQPPHLLISPEKWSGVCKKASRKTDSGESHGWPRVELVGWLVVMGLEGKQRDTHEYIAAIQKT